ncbi:MAG: ATP:cob(I)alamin adenosyltransferase [Verrucomicrobia bacterium]|nr:MAG: ATP:cob(I)alamin adenosyltransferase [Verrucomicrobiota bacterium]
MSIVTKTGDRGTTGLMYNRRVPKNHPRVEAYGAVDELDACLGVARVQLAREPTEIVLKIQQDLVIVMGELATVPADLPRYTKDGFSVVTAAMTSRLEHQIGKIERAQPPLRGWAMPGANGPSAALHLARTVCRRAERRVSALQEAGELPNAELIVYLNRLSDLLWLLARQEELRAKTKRRTRRHRVAMPQK